MAFFSGFCAPHRKYPHLRDAGCSCMAGHCLFSAYSCYCCEAHPTIRFACMLLQHLLFQIHDKVAGSSWALWCFIQSFSISYLYGPRAIARLSLEYEFLLLAETLKAMFICRLWSGLPGCGANPCTVARLSRKRRWCWTNVNEISSCSCRSGTGVSTSSQIGKHRRIHLTILKYFLL